MILSYFFARIVLVINQNVYGMQMRVNFLCGKVMAPHGAKSVYYHNNSRKHQITTLVCLSTACRECNSTNACVPNGEISVRDEVHGSYLGRSRTG